MSEGKKNTGGHEEDHAAIDVELDCVGLYCPMPVTMTREAVEEMAPGQVIRVTADDPAAEEDIARWARRTGNDLLELRSEGTVMTFVIRKG
ncbi:MAG TPA: sulfurtransferase TusA family protein [Candidatus Krumholzibacterium sp.]|nr:sulfurtransferase TusA family protein [Candidatus Krumholzibacterium sp.]